MVLPPTERVDIRHVLLDLDGTLYYNPLVDRIMIREIELFLQEDLGFAQSEAIRVRQELNAQHGSTLSGLIANGYAVDVPSYQKRVHALDYAALIRPNPALKKLLSQIRLPVYVFTNGDAGHAVRSLQSMEMQDLFKGVISFDTLQESARAAGVDTTRRVVCKPNPLAFQLALKEVGARAATTLFIDDNVQNVESAKALGMQTLLVSPEEAPETSLRRVTSLMELPETWPSLFSHSGENDKT